MSSGLLRLRTLLSYWLFIVIILIVFRLFSMPATLTRLYILIIVMPLGLFGLRLPSCRNINLQALLGAKVSARSPLQG